MIILDATNKSVELDLNGAVTTNQLPFVASWVDVTTTTTTPGTTTGQSNSTTAVTMVAAPGASTQRIVKYLSVKNSDTVDALLWVQFNDNTTLRELLKLTLSVNDTLEYIEGLGWSVINTSGQKKSLASISGTVAVTQSGTWDEVGINDSGNSITVDGTITANAGTNLNTSALALEAGGNLATVAGAIRAEDAASADTHTGIGALAVRKATPANTSGTDGDYEFLQMSAGRVWTSSTIDAAIPAGTNNIGDVDIASFAGGAITEVQGDVAHDAAVGGNPVLNGFEARTSDGTAVASGDAVRGLADTLGKQVIVQGAIHDLQSNGTANYTTSTAADLIAAAGAGVRIAVTSVLVTNAHATVSTKVEIRDGTTVKIQGYAVAAGGGFALSAGGRPLFISTANTAVTGRAVTTGSDIDISVSGYRIAN